MFLVSKIEVRILFSAKANVHVMTRSFRDLQTTPGQNALKYAIQSSCACRQWRDFS